MKQKIKGKEYTERKVMNAFDRFYKIASDNDVMEGQEWYKEAYKVCEGLGKKFDVPVFVVAGIVAIQSSQVSWNVNQIFTKQFLEGRGSRVVGNLQKSLKCRKVLKATTPEEVASLISVKPDGGPKTKAFYWAILGYEDRKACVVDRHIIAAATQHPKKVYAMGDTNGGITDKQYHFLADCLTKFAEKRGESVSGCQAKIWNSYRTQRNLFANKTYTEWWEGETEVLEDAPF